MSEIVLVGDVGGTSCRFALARRGDHGIVLEHVKKYSEPKNDQGRVDTPLFPNFEDTLADYLSGHGIAGDSLRALFALAGPPEDDGSVLMTNRSFWPRIVPGTLAARFGLTSVTLVNDFAAMARAIPEMSSEDMVEILPGKPRRGAPFVVTGPGTGFGIATLVQTPAGRWIPITGQGGHAAYAAHTVREAELAEALMKAHGYVSTEMVVSGIWLKPVFDILSDFHGVPRRDIRAPEILAGADEGDPVCVETCLLRARGIMGAAGDVVLINGGQGGVVLTGGVAERMPAWLKHSEAVARFRSRGSETPFMADVPVSVLMNPEAPLIGAAALVFDQA
ncbi:MAG: glucokinase [Pseudomonadota bacterium]